MRARDLMIPGSECARVAEDRTIYDAVMMLEAWRRRFQSEYGPRVVFVQNKDFRIIGSLGQADMLRALSNARVNSSKSDLSHSSEPQPVLKPSSGDPAAGWDEVLTQLYLAANNFRVKDAMHLYGKAEYIDEDASAEETLDRLLSGPYVNLVVVSGNSTIGIVRLSDVFSRVCRQIKRFGMK